MPIFAPIRSTVRAAVRIAGFAARPAVRASEALVQRLTGGEDERPRATAATPAPPARPAAPSAPVRLAEPTPAPAEPDQPEFQPAHIIEEAPEIVHSTADIGAQDGAGATLRIGEPWSGYRGMTASDVIDRLVVADRATLAAVALFEASHRRRATVLQAAEEHLARAAGRN